MNRYIEAGVDSDGEEGAYRDGEEARREAASHLPEEPRWGGIPEGQRGLDEPPLKLGLAVHDLCSRWREKSIQATTAEASALLAATMEKK